MSERIEFGRPFVIKRDRDRSEVSGTGIVADGVLFPDGHAVIHWRGKWPLTTPHPDGLASIIDIHDHGGAGENHIIFPDQLESDSLGEAITVALKEAATEWSQSWFPVQGMGSAPGKIRLTGLLDDFTSAVLQVVHRGGEPQANAQLRVDEPRAADEDVPPHEGLLTGIEVRDPCPRCEDWRLIPRLQMDEHRREHHPELANGQQDPELQVPDEMPLEQP